MPRRSRRRGGLIGDGTDMCMRFSSIVEFKMLVDHRSGRKGASMRMTQDGLDYAPLNWLA